ncbi:MAG: gas vesicle protein [Solirubrobacterales bacterium]|nr:gas vesicle protein [Solirubrobacterales bacterium]
MAEQRSRRNQNGSRRNSKLSGREAIERVRADLPELLGHPVDSILGLERADEGKGWTVTAQVVELSRIPRSTDVLGAYEVTLDDDGELVGARRQGRY